MKNKNRSVQVLRGISVISIVLYHAFPNVFSAGYLGVDLFFVISGFVIAPKIEQIVHSKKSLNEMKIFFTSRFWRLIPALSVTLILSLIFIFILGGIGYIKNSLLQALFTSVFLGNVSGYYFLGDYFQPMPNPLVHTWSLSLEEQIYIFTPISFLILSRVLKTKKVAWLYIFMLSISLAFLFIAPSLSLDRFSFYSPVTRYWEFCLGALIFFANRSSLIKSPSNSKKNPFNATFLLFVLVALMLFGPHSVVLIFALVAIFYRVFFRSLDFASPKYLLNFTCYLGDRSYSIYLVHMPLIWIFSYSPILSTLGFKQKTSYLIFLSIILTLLIGVLLYESIEVKYRDSRYRSLLGKQIVLRRSVWLSTFLFMMIGLGLIAESQNFWLQRTVLSRPINQMDRAVNEKCDLMNGNKPCIFGSNFQSNSLLIGDSHAGSIALTLRKIANEESRFHVFLQPGCQFMSIQVIKDNSKIISNDQCLSYSAKISEYVNRNDFKEIFVSYRSTMFVPIGYNITGTSYREKQLRSLIDLQKACDCRIILIGPTPEFPIKPDYFESNRLLLWGNENSSKLVRRSLMIRQPFDDDLFWQKNVSRLDEDIHYISVIQSFCNNYECARWRNGWLYSDADHLSAYGAKSISEVIRNKLETF